jgi:hypothetical protein
VKFTALQMLVTVSVELNLIVINPSTVFNISDSICQGDSYNFGSQNLTAAGTYTEIFTAAAGCDSVVQLSLSVIALPNISISAIGNELFASAGFSSYLWYFNGQPIAAATSDSYTPTQSGNYYVEAVNSQGCSNLSNTIALSG